MKEEHRNKLSKIMKENCKNLEFQKKRIAGIKKYNNNLPDGIRETRRKNGLKNKGIKRTPEQIRKMIETGRRIRPSNPKNRTTRGTPYIDMGT